MSTTAVERVYAGRSGAERSAERRAALIEAALDLLSEAGSVEFGMRPAIRRAGLSARYFYESFADRDALVRAAFDVALGRMQAAVETAMADGGTLHAAFLAATTLIDDEPRIGHVLFREPFADAVLREHARAVIPGFFLTALGSGAAVNLSSAHGRAARQVLELRLTALSGALISLFLARTEGTARIARPRFADFCVEVVGQLG